MAARPGAAAALCCACAAALAWRAGGHVSGDLFDVESVRPLPGLPLVAAQRNTTLRMVVRDGFDDAVPFARLLPMHARAMHLLVVHAEANAAVLHLHPVPLAAASSPPSSSSSDAAATLAARVPSGLPYRGLYYLSWSFLVDADSRTWAQVARARVRAANSGRRTTVTRPSRERPPSPVHAMTPIRSSESY